jgi:hypothetical protein
MLNERNCLKFHGIGLVLTAKIESRHD